MKGFKKVLISISAILLFNILLISICNRLIEDSWWKYSHGAHSEDVLEFDDSLQAKSIFIQAGGETQKIIVAYFFDYMITSDKDLSNWTYYARKGKKGGSNQNLSSPEFPDVITITPGDTRLLDSLTKEK